MGANLSLLTSLTLLTYDSQHLILLEHLLQYHQLLLVPRKHQKVRITSRKSELSLLLVIIWKTIPQLQQYCRLERRSQLMIIIKWILGLHYQSFLRNQAGLGRQKSYTRQLSKRQLHCQSKSTKGGQIYLLLSKYVSSQGRINMPLPLLLFQITKLGIGSLKSSLPLSYCQQINYYCTTTPLSSLLYSISFSNISLVLSLYLLCNCIPKPIYLL